MQCPVCQIDQVIVEYQDVELDICIDGHGLWFDNDELRQLFEVAGVPEGLRDLEDHLVELPSGRHGPEKRCPRCRGKMRHVSAPGEAGDVILDRCRRGHGLWFDKGELEEILRTALGAGDSSLATIQEFIGRFVPEQVVPREAQPESPEASGPSQANGGSETQ